jgi:hypothetical protein
MRRNFARSENRHPTTFADAGYGLRFGAVFYLVALPPRPRAVVSYRYSAGGGFSPQHLKS